MRAVPAPTRVTADEFRKRICSELELLAASDEGRLMVAIAASIVRRRAVSSPDR